MKRLTFLVSAMLLACSTLGAFSQTQPNTTDKVLKDTVIKTVSYKLYLGSRGGRYVLITSKTGNVYKKYFKH